MSSDSDAARGGARAGLSRRDVLAGAAAVAGAAVASASTQVLAQARPQPSTASTSRVVAASDRGAIAETTAGKVRGFTSGGIVTFKGIPYAASPAGPARFMPPSSPTPWAGVRSSLWYGPTCPQGARGGWQRDEEAFVFEWDDGQPGEDCLRVNVWTPGLDNAKRPVMVWIHGGQFLAGSGQELKSYHGENISRRGDVVVVTLNHRLNVLGYLDLSAYGERYASSANAGMLDLVAALGWVRDNIASFGGDPGKVTIFGQSGGGAKVSALLAMPAAQGLFHRAAVQSGSGLRMVPRTYSTRLAAQTLAELGVSAAQVEPLHTMPHARLLAAAQAAQRTLATGGTGGTGTLQRFAVSDRNGLAAVVDGVHLPQHPFDPAAPAVSAQVPMLIGSTLNEFANEIQNAGIEAITGQDLRTRATAAFRDQATRVLEAYMRAMPGARPPDVYSRIAGATQRLNAIAQATRKHAQGGAPAFLYWFTWQTPILDGRPRAFHCAELPFVFNNAERCAAMTGGTPEAIELVGRMSDAWIAFARTGNPAHAGIPAWPAFEPSAGPVMVFDRACALRNDPDRTERSTIPTV